MPKDLPFLTDTVRVRSIRLLNARLVAAICVIDELTRSTRHVIGLDFIMIDEDCGNVARLLTGCCKQIADRVQGLGGDTDWPVQGLSADAACSCVHTSADDELEVAASTIALQAFGRSVLDAIAIAAVSGDATTVDMLTSLWRDIDGHRGTVVRRPESQV